MNYYRRFTKTLANKGILIPSDEEVYDHIDDADLDYYQSIYEYNEEQYNRFKETGSVAGIKDVTTTKLVWDFDDEQNPEQARNDAINLVQRLEDHGIQAQNLIISFSGNKGYGVELVVDKRLTVDQFKSITKALAVGLETYDSVVSDPSRVVRILGTKHQKSHLYKYPLTKEQLNELSIEQIRKKAKNPPEGNFKWEEEKLPSSIFKLAEVKKVEKKVELNPVSLNIDFYKKIKGWTNCKHALCQGYEIKAHDRHTKLTAIVATAKSLNYTEGQAYYTAKHAMKEGAALYGDNECSKDDIGSIVKSVYSPSWVGGTYSCKDGKSPWLTDVCNSLGVNRCQALNIDVVQTSDVFGLFNEYAENFDKNVLKTGIEALDERCKFMVGTSNGILGGPACGKTTLSLSILNYNSLNNIPCLFFSYDMFHSMVYLRLIQKHFNLHQDKIFDIFRHDKIKAFEIKEKLEEEYKNVHFCFKSGQTADEMYETILDTEQKIGNKLKLVMVDYNELVISNVSDPTQASSQTAQRLRQIANDTSSCVITLLQPSKHFSNPADEIVTYNGAKGSGAIAQSMSLMLSLARPGFHPRRPEDDRFISINALKNRQGPLFTLDLGWNGATGDIYELNEEQLEELNEIKAARSAERNNLGET